jgi:hypothetical protein
MLVPYNQYTIFLKLKTYFLGNDDNPIHCRTFLGHILHIGDSVMGLDLKNSNVNNDELDKMNTDKVQFMLLLLFLCY